MLMISAVVAGVLETLVGTRYGRLSSGERPIASRSGDSETYGGHPHDPSRIDPAARAAARCRGAGRTDGRQVFPFGPLEGAFMAASGDAHGTMIEVYPERATLDIPDRDDQVVFGENQAPPQNWPFHMLLSVPLQPEQVERIGAREGWRAKTFGRGMKDHEPFFHVIESGWKTG